VGALNCLHSGCFLFSNLLEVADDTSEHSNFGTYIRQANGHQFAATAELRQNLTIPFTTAHDNAWKMLERHILSYMYRLIHTGNYDKSTLKCTSNISILKNTLSKDHH